MGYDFEGFQKDLRTLLRTSLPGKIAAINSEKNDGLTLAAPADADYYLDKYPDFANVGSPWVLIIQEEPISVEVAGPNQAQSFSILIAIGHNSVMNQAATSRVAQEERLGDMFKRYTRAVQDTVAQNFSGIKGRTLLAVESIPTPIPFGEGPNESQLCGLVRIAAKIA